MSLANSPEFFINMKAIPDENSVEWHPFFQAELDKIKYGVTINGIFIHGWLYWHLNHWMMWKFFDDPRNPKDTIRKLGKPDFRDSEWIIAEHIKMAEEQKKGLLIFGSRRLGKTIFESSWLGRSATIYEGSENVLVGTNEADIKVLSSALDKGLNELHPYFRFERLTDDWRKEVALGYKAKKRGGQRYEHSKIYIRNLDGGKNTEAVAGTTPKALVIDEVGKDDWLEAFVAAVPAFSSPNGWMCVPIAVGTGGTFETNSDAEKVFKNPDAYNFLAVEWPNKKNKYGLFMPGHFRMEGKVKTTFGDYIQRKSGILLPEGSELAMLEFDESNIDKANEATKKELEQFEKSHDPKAALKIRMYYPEDPDDCFLNAEVNQFPVEAIEQQIRYLDELEAKRGFIGEAVELYRDVNGKVCFSTNTKLAEIRDWPVNAATLKDAPTIIYEPPVDNPPPFLYIAGSDPYNVADSVISPSLGTVYIFKRFYDAVSGSYQNMIVASLASRPGRMVDWHRNVEMLLELYNATCMIENMGTNFIEYMDGKHKGFMMAEGYNIVLEVSPNTGLSRSRSIGLPATPKVISHCMGLAYDYCNEEILATDDKGNQIKKLGVCRIMDRMLLVEMKNYNSEDNFDRIVAFRHVLAYDNHLQKIAPIVRFTDEPEPMVKPPSKTPFSKHSPFPSIGRSPFPNSRLRRPF